jgi:exopolysaccharide biosynthesis WecB/TagA/CpsF family protein
MIHRGKHNLLGILVDAIDYEAAVNKIISSAKASRPFSVTALAVHGLMVGAMDKSHRHRLNRFDLVCPDGQPVRWGINALHRTDLAVRVYGPTLMLKTCQKAEQEGVSVFLLGGDEALLNRLSDALLKKYPQLKIAGRRPSKFRELTTSERSEMITEVRESGAQILFVGLGCPRQEIFVYECCEDFQMPCLAVGAAFAFHAGVMAQAPAYIQKYGLEWLFRLLHEPRRLWRRYLFLNPAFVALFLLQWTKIRCLDVNDTQEPTSEHAYG